MRSPKAHNQEQRCEMITARHTRCQAMASSRILMNDQDHTRLICTTHWKLLESRNPTFRKRVQWWPIHGSGCSCSTCRSRQWLRGRRV